MKISGQAMAILFLFFVRAIPKVTRRIKVIK
jgi:hypothetical protein